MFIKKSRKVGMIIFLCIIAFILFFQPVFRPILPPVLAIGLAFFTREVLFSLFSGIWMGAVIVLGFNDFGSFFSALFKGFFNAVDTYIIKGLNDSSHLMIIVFSLTIGGMVGVIGKSGGMIGIVRIFKKFTKTSRGAEMTTWFMGILIFFDDYANTLIVGNAMRPLTDKYKVSREKLSFIIDSTAAPVASLALISTWIGYEVGLIGDALKKIGSDVDPYLAFVYSLPYRFYAILLLIMIPVYIIMRREFGTMYKAEVRSINSEAQIILDEEEEKDGKNRWYNAVIPIGLMILTVAVGIGITGYNSVLKAGTNDFSLTNIVSNSDSFSVLIWGSLLGTVAAIGLMVFQGLAGFEEAVNHWIEGVKHMIVAVLILTMAWALSSITSEVKTADFIASSLSDTLSITLLPMIVFMLSAVTAFATGTSWGTMAILFPTAIPLISGIGQSQGLPAEEIIQMVYIVTGSILTGSIFGDHCSPISDTTIMSSMASEVNHIEHVRTQLPYALLFGVISIVFGYLPAGFGVNPYILILLQLTAAIAFIMFYGKKLPVVKSES